MMNSIKHYVRMDLIDIHNIMKELDSNEFKKFILIIWV